MTEATATRTFFQSIAFGFFLRRFGQYFDIVVVRKSFGRIHKRRDGMLATFGFSQHLIGVDGRGAFAPARLRTRPLHTIIRWHQRIVVMQQHMKVITRFNRAKRFALLVQQVKGDFGGNIKRQITAALLDAFFLNDAQDGKRR